mmetsp:Transcript_5637/g.7859  ORF Transcript_5637/g.7859 Transcript_5637/m.7859 type:complete len:201 (-) Transcript_5637:35-637(-)
MLLKRSKEGAHFLIMLSTSSFNATPFPSGTAFTISIMTGYSPLLRSFTFGAGAGAGAFSSSLTSFSPSFFSASSSFFSSSAAAGGFFTRCTKPDTIIANGTAPSPSLFMKTIASPERFLSLRALMIPSTPSAEGLPRGRGSKANSTGHMASSSVSAKLPRKLFTSAGPGVPSSGAGLEVVKHIKGALLSTFISFFSPLAV